MTAENRTVAGHCGSARPGFNEAAADDRGKPQALEQVARRGGLASMRPRPMTAENPPDPVRGHPPSASLQ